LRDPDPELGVTDPDLDLNLNKNHKNNKRFNSYEIKSSDTGTLIKHFLAKYALKSMRRPLKSLAL
jgi:hypothetical protein